MFAQRKPGSPLDQLPTNIEMLTYFGERADFSPDNQRVAFMAKSFGDAFVIDLKTRAIRCLTCNVPGAAFLRVMHLSTGDYLLIGPERFTDIRTSRGARQRAVVPQPGPGSKPVRLGQKMSEGAADFQEEPADRLSRKPVRPEPRSAQGRVAAHRGRARPRRRAAALNGKKVVRQRQDNAARSRRRTSIDNDTQVTFTCYEPEGHGLGLDASTSPAGKSANHVDRPRQVQRSRRHLPRRHHTCVEADRQGGSSARQAASATSTSGSSALDGTGKNFTRLTRFNDYEGWKASNPVVSTDGRLMAFQVARTADEAGVGYGILLMRFAGASR